jgi:hypothetical protein
MDKMNSSVPSPVEAVLPTVRELKCRQCQALGVLKGAKLCGLSSEFERKKKVSNRGIERARNETVKGRKTLEKKEWRNSNKRARETQYTDDGASVCHKAVGRERKHTNTKEEG